MRKTMMTLLLLGAGCLLGFGCAGLLVDKYGLLDIRAATLEALSFLEPLRRSPDGEHGNGVHDQERVEKTGPARHGAARNPLRSHAWGRNRSSAP